MKDGVSINRKVQLAFAAAIIAKFAEDAICNRGRVACVDAEQWMRHSREALCSGMQKVAAHKTTAEEQTRSGWRASPDGGCSGGDK
jgi:hypothetical protein